LKRITVKKGEIFQRKGDLNSKAYSVKSGLLRSYSIDEKGKEHIFLFAPEDWMIADSNSYDEPADLFIDALEDSELIVIEKIGSPENHTDKLLKRLAVLQKRVIMLMSSTAIERYEHFVETYPDIVQRVPQKMIASYLGITPEALSKVKKERFTSK
jgi:CRP-like cAMP-binding protein